MVLITHNATGDHVLKNAIQKPSAGFYLLSYSVSIVISDLKNLVVFKTSFLLPSLSHCSYDVILTQSWFSVQYV